MSNEIATYLKYANLQIAAEAFYGLKEAEPGTPFSTSTAGMTTTRCGVVAARMCCAAVQATTYCVGTERPRLVRARRWTPRRMGRIFWMGGQVTASKHLFAASGEEEVGLLSNQ